MPFLVLFYSDRTATARRRHGHGHGHNGHGNTDTATRTRHSFLKVSVFDLKTECEALFMKWYNFETMFRSLKDGLTEYLKTIGIRYELSGCGKGWHFEILLSPSEVTDVNNWLDMHTITAK